MSDHIAIRKTESPGVQACAVHMVQVRIQLGARARLLSSLSQGVTGLGETTQCPEQSTRNIL